MKIFIKLSFFLITIIFLFITSKAQSKMLYARPPGSDCDKYLKERGWIRGENKRKNHDGKSRFFIVGVGHSYLSHYERDEQGKEKKFNLPGGEVVLKAQVNAFVDALNRYKYFVGFKIKTTIDGLVITDKISIKNAEIKLLETIPDQEERRGVCSVVAIIPN